MPSFGTGGAERVVFNLMNGLHNHGHKVELILLLANGFLVKRLPSDVSVNIYHHRRLLTATLTIIKALKSDSDLIFCSGYHNQYVALLAYLTSTSHKLVLRETSLIGVAKSRRGQSLWRIPIPFLYNFCRRIIFQSKYGKEDFQAFFNFNLLKSSVLVNPVFSKGQVSFSGQNIFLVGTLSKNKNHAEALFAIDKSGLDNVTVEIFGDGPERRSLEELTKSLLNIHVVFHGYVDSLDNHWSRCALHVLTSKFESLPNVVIEASSHGVPSVCLNVPGGLSELFELGNWGLLVNESEQLALAINKIYNWDQNQRNNLAEEAQIAFSIQAMKNYLNFLT